MQNNFKYINLSWAVVGFCEAPHQPLLSCIPGIDNDDCPASPASTMTRLQPWSITSSATWPSGTSPLWMRTASCPATTMPCATMPARR